MTRKASAQGPSKALMLPFDMGCRACGIHFFSRNARKIRSSGDFSSTKVAENSENSPFKISTRSAFAMGCAGSAQAKVLDVDSFSDVSPTTSETRASPVTVTGI